MNLIIPLIILGGVLGLLYAYTSTKGYNTLCPIKLVTGFPCPGCGMTRAHFALLHFNLTKAFYYHPLFILPAFFFLLFLFQDIQWIHRIQHSKWFYPLVMVLIFSVYVYRMVNFFPDIVPLDYLEENLLKKIWDFIPK